VEFHCGLVCYRVKYVVGLRVGFISSHSEACCAETDSRRALLEVSSMSLSLLNWTDSIGGERFFCWYFLSSVSSRVSFALVVLLSSVIACCV
jgi:hypothetical protein